MSVRWRVLSLRENACVTDDLTDFGKVIRCDDENEDSLTMQCSDDCLESEILPKLIRTVQCNRNTNTMPPRRERSLVH